MRPAIIFNLSSVLFKSYLRAGRSSKLSRVFSQPRIMLVINLVALVIPAALLQYFFLWMPLKVIKLMEPLIWQALVGLPIMLTSAIIVAGILFELGQSAGLSSSEAVNWLPISPREYVAASAISIVTMYSPLFAISVGVTLPLALKFSLMHVWPATVILSALALLLGAFIVEILKAAMNTVSSTVYRRGGRFAVVSRLVLLVVLFVIIQMAFNPYILYRALGVMVSGVDLVWFIPMIWPSVTVMSLIRLETYPMITFSVLSVAFTLLIFETASNLRLKYWSPAPVSIVIKSSPEYIPHTTALSRFGFSPLEAAIALKEFRVLVRRKDMARFIAIPIIIIISLILPTLFTSGYSGSYPGLFLMVFIPFIIPLMLSMITIGQEGKAVINLCMLPIPAKQLIKGKLFPAWIMATIATITTAAVLQIIAPMNIHTMLAAISASMLLIVVESFIGLGVGSRYPDYTIGSRSRYVTFKGFLIGFLAGGVSTLAIFAPIALHLISSGGIQGSAPIPPISLNITLPITLLIGSILSYFTYKYCKKGIENILSNQEV